MRHKVKTTLLFQLSLHTNFYEKSPKFLLGYCKNELLQFITLTRDVFQRWRTGLLTPKEKEREREGKEDTPNHPSKSFQIGKRSVDRPFVNCRNARHIIRLDRDDSSLLCPALPPPDRMRQHVIFELNLLSGVTHSTGQHSKSFLNYRWSWKLLNWTFPIQKSNKEAKHTGYLRQFESMTRWLRSEKTQNPYR